jgi:hypothetical protein
MSFPLSQIALNYQLKTEVTIRKLSSIKPDFRYANNLVHDDIESI